jgi:uncharacterized phage protein gp47/JayE
MPFTRSTLQTIIDRITSDFEFYIEGGTSFLRRSFLRILAKVNGGAFHLVYEFLDYQARQLFAITADIAGLEAHSSEWGVPRNVASAATGSATATGSTGTLIPEGTKLTSTDNQVYSTTADTTVAGGTATISFEADIAGEDGNDDAGITLTFVTPIVGVNSTATVDSDGITGGTDDEDPEDLRARILTRKREPPHGGTETDYKNWMFEISGVTRAWTIPLYQGAGTIAVAFARDNDASLFPTADQRTAMFDYLVEHEDPGSGLIVGVPVTAQPGLQVLALTALPIVFEIAISPNTADVQADVTAELEDLMLRHGGPGETIYLSDVNEAISLGVGDGWHRIVEPTNDLVATNDQLHTLGPVTYSDY